MYFLPFIVQKILNFRKMKYLYDFLRPIKKGRRDIVGQNAFVGPSAEEAVEKMLTQYGDELFRLCVLYLKDVHEAQDAVQETFIKVYRNWHSFRHESSEKTWLIRIAIHTCRDMCRKPWFGLIDRYTVVDDVSSWQERDFLNGDVTRAVMELNEKYRVPVLLHYYHGLSVKDVASVLNIPLNTVLTRLKRGRDQLRGKLTEGGELR